MANINISRRQILQKSLQEGSDNFCATPARNKLATALQDACPGIRKAFLLECIPEQAEDIYFFLIGKNKIIVLEVPRISNTINNNVLVSEIDVKSYIRRTNRETRERLTAALELI